MWRIPIAALFCACVATAQTVPAGGGVKLYGGTMDIETGAHRGGVDLSSSVRTGDRPCSKSGEFAVAPLPIVNPTIGDGLALVVGYLVDLSSCEAQTPPTVFGLGGLWTNNGSWGLGGGTNLVLGRDRFRITIGGGGGQFNYPFYGIGNSSGSEGASIEFHQRSVALLVEPKMRVWRDWYLGPRYYIVDNSVSFDPSEIAPALPPVDDLNLRTAALGLRGQRDTRDNTMYPGTGSFLDSTLDFYDAAFGGVRNYGSFLLSYNRYFSFGAKNVLAMRGSMCSTWNDAPFYDLCLLGRAQGLRGYPMGQYRDKKFLAAQVEYRRELIWRLGAVAFIGAGEVGETFAEFNAGDIVPGGGFGLRFLVAKQNHVNVRIDYAWGRDSHALYVGVAEVF